jgi:hypothetical membrane protein
VKTERALGVLGIGTAYLFIAMSIAISPWFNFYNNALSDLGNTALHPSTGLVYNVGLILGGVLVALFAVLTSLRNSSWKYLVWTIPLTIAGIDLALIGVFPENAGSIHLIVSLVFFVMIDLTMFIYSYISWPLGSHKIGAVALAFGIASAAVWFAPWPWRGVAIQETLTSVMGAVWLILVALKNA